MEKVIRISNEPRLPSWNLFLLSTGTKLIINLTCNYRLTVIYEVCNYEANITDQVRKSVIRGNTSNEN